MGRGFRLGWVAILGLGGCATTPPVDNPVLVKKSDAIENPVLVSPGVPNGVTYRKVFEKCYDILLSAKFEIPPGGANPYAGRIETKPRIMPGYEQIWRSGNPDPRGRLLATFQTLRQTVVIEIRTGERGGYLVSVVVEKEMEDVAKPTRQKVGAVFQEAPTVSRGLEVVGPISTASSTSWFPVGRDFATEQLFLQQIRECR